MMAGLGLHSGPCVEIHALAPSRRCSPMYSPGPGGMQRHNETGPCKAETADGKDDFCSGGQGLASIWISFIAPQRALSSSQAALNNHNWGLFLAPFLSLFKCHLVSNKIHTWNSVFDLGRVCVLPGLWVGFWEKQLGLEM